MYVLVHGPRALTRIGRSASARAMSVPAMQGVCLVQGLLGLIPGVGNLGVDHQIHRQLYVVSEWAFHAGLHDISGLLGILLRPFQDQLTVLLPHATNDHKVHSIAK